MSDIEQRLREAMDALVAIAEGYPVRGEADRFVIVENPKFREDDGSDPNICIDTFELRDAARKKADTIASLRSKLEEAEGAPKIAVICDNEGVCLSGRWAGWLFRKHPDGQWVSVQKLELRDPFEGNPMITALASLREADHA